MSFKLIKNYKLNLFSFLYIFSFLILFSFKYTYGTEICVGPSDTGNGSGTDWNNVISWERVNFLRGNTYYLKSGEYRFSKTLNTPPYGSVYIKIKKATEEDHGPNIGWRNDYGKGPAIFNHASIIIETSFWEIDGVIGGGPNNWTTEYGIQFLSNVGTNINYISLNNVEYIRLKSISFTQLGNIINPNKCNAIYAPGIVNNSIFEKLYINNITGLPFFFRYGSGNIIQYNFTGDICGISDYDINQHCEALVMHGMNDMHFRWNYIGECPSSGGFVKNSSPDTKDIRIYGNIFTNGFPINCNTGSCTNWRIFNNTFQKFSGGPVGGDGTFYNLLFYNNLMFSASYIGFLIGSHDYNWFSSISNPRCNMSPSPHENIIKRYPSNCDIIIENTDPFVNSTSSIPDGFKLKKDAKPIDIGYNVCLLDPCLGEKKYNIDIYGNNRPMGLGWDIGAFEYIGFEDVKPKPPQNLKITN